MKEINLLNSTKIEENLKSYGRELIYTKDGGRHPLARYASFDYCFNYFQGFKDKKELADPQNIQNSCLHLGFYLASWGMYRGPAILLQKSVKIFENLITKYIALEKCDVWDIDANKYTKDNIDKLIKCYETIVEELGVREEQKSMDTLVTKIMLGVFGNVPAFDGYFKTGSGLNTFNTDALEKISGFYKERQKDIDKEVKKVKTFEYHSGKESNRLYTKAKIIDMIFFIEGLEIEKLKKDQKMIKKQNEKNIKKIKNNK